MKVYKSRLKYRREDAGLSQAELSAQSGVSLRSIQMYEQGQRDINKAEVVTVLQMAEALKCDIRDIINPW
jgi:transcriptional regulator with XRE-family HTH domain